MKLETFFEKFDQFADAPGAVAKMRDNAGWAAPSGLRLIVDAIPRALPWVWRRPRRWRSESAPQRGTPRQPGATPQENRPPFISSPEGAGQRVGFGCASGFVFTVLDRPFRA